MTYEEVVKLAFMDELEQIFRARGDSIPSLEKLGADLRLHELIKEARFLQALRKMVPKSGTAKFMEAAKAQGLGDVAKGALKKAKPMARLEQWGKTIRQTPVQRVRAAAKAATDPTSKAMLKMRPGDVRGLTQATKGVGGTSLGKRMLGAAAEGMGAHTGHASKLRLAGSHVGVPVGGAIEGLMTQAGRELKSVGTGLRARTAGQMTSGAAARRAAGQFATGAGGAIQKGAPAAAKVTEWAALGATGAPILSKAVGGGLAAATGLKASGLMGVVAKKAVGEQVLGAAEKGVGVVSRRLRGLSPMAVSA